MLFSLLFVGTALQRLGELSISNSNVAHLKRRGAFEVGQEHYPWMVVLHFFWFVAMLLEKGLCPTDLGWKIEVMALVMVSAGQVLRYLAITTLGRRWTTRVLILPETPRLKNGVFSVFSHPNYLGVCLEILGLPLLGGNWRTALLFTILNLLLLRRRLSVEEAALQSNRIGGADHAESQ